jgi:GNAT superfamily N-acetyltransferase
LTQVRRVSEEDYPRWRELFEAYTRFYEREPSEAQSRYTWSRILDPGSPVKAVVAIIGARVVGIANYLVHDSTSSLAPVCLLQDLFVDPSARGGQVGKLLIDWLAAEMKSQGWSRLYWHTRENNYRARALYDRYTPHSGFLRYVIDNK